MTFGPLFLFTSATLAFLPSSPYQPHSTFFHIPLPERVVKEGGERYGEGGTPPPSDPDWGEVWGGVDPHLASDAEVSSICSYVVAVVMAGYRSRSSDLKAASLARCCSCEGEGGRERRAD